MIDSVRNVITTDFHVFASQFFLNNLHKLIGRTREKKERFLFVCCSEFNLNNMRNQRVIPWTQEMFAFLLKTEMKTNEKRND